MANPLVPAQQPSTLMPPQIALDPATMARMGIANPFAPPVDPAPSPSLGFQTWASDPRNAMKVSHAMTTPDTPLQPNAGKQPRTDQLDNSAFEAFGRDIAANAPNPFVPPASPGGKPGEVLPPSAAVPKLSASVPSAPTVAALTPEMQATQGQLGADQAELERLQGSGAAANHIKNPFLRTLAKAGDIAAPFLVGRGAMAIPGTTAHNLWLQGQQQGRINQDQNALQKELQNYLTQATIGKTQARTAQIPVNDAYRKMQLQSTLAQHGLTAELDANGQPTGNIVPDTNSPVYQTQQIKNQAVQAQTAYLQAGVQLRAAQAALAAAKNDPNSPAYKLAKQEQDRLAAMMPILKERSDAYWGSYLQRAQNVGLNGQVLPGAPQVADNSGRETAVGTANASHAVKAQSNVAMFNEVENATKSMRQAATQLVRSGGELNDPRVAAAIADPKSTAGQWAQGQFASSGLSPQQRDYVIAVKAYKERLQPLRKSAGGSVSDSQVDRLMALAPGAQTPDLDFLNRQLEQIDQLRSNLAEGVTTVKGGLKVTGRGNPYAAPKVSYQMTASGPKGQKIGSNDGGKTWFDTKTGKRYQ